VNLLADEGAGGLTKNGNGTLTLSGANNDYTGPTVLNAGSLVLSSGATLPNSSAISVGSGTTFDISAASFVLGTNQVLSGSGTVTGSIAASSGPGSGLNAATAGTAGTLTISGNVDLSVGATIGFDLSPSASSGNDQIVVGGNLTLSSSDTIHIKGLSGTANLDSSADYVLFSVSGTTTVGSQPALVWDVPKPANYGHYVIATSGNNVVLHYLTGTPPTITSATITPSTLTRNQSAFVSVTVANGTGSVDPNTGVVLAAAQGQVPLVLSATPNVYTNTIVIPASANVGLETNTVTATDSLALSGISTVVVTVVAANQVWNGAGPDINTDDNMNWVSGMAPGYVGDSVTFAGSTQPTPNLDANYSFTGIAFDSTATNFNLSTLNSSVLTLTAPASIANASTNDQTISLPIAGTNGLTKTGNGTLTLSAASTYTGGTAINAGRLVALDNAQALGAGNVSIATNATLEVNYSGSLKIAGTTLTGTGTLQKTGAGTLTLGQSGINGGTVNISLSGGALIDLQAGTLESSSAYQGNWDNNKASLNVAGGAIFQVKETQVNVDALTGSGTVEQDYGGNGIYVGVNNGSGTFSGVIQDGAVSLALTKSGSGTQTLSGANTYTGSTTVSNGTLLVNGSLAAGSAVTVASGALGGVGSIGGATTVNAGGYLAPGTNGVGTLTFANNLTLNAASTNNFVVTANGASNNVAVTGTLTPNGSVIHIAAGTALGLGTNTLFTCGTISGAFSAAPVFDVAQNNVGSIVNDGAGHINLVMVTGVNTDPATANFAASVTGSAGSKTLNFTWAPDHKGWQLYTNAVGLTATGSWFPVPGSASVTNESITVDSTKPNVFFQLRYP
jgi:autotransporter-associated beta strand protein